MEQTWLGVIRESGRRPAGSGLVEYALLVSGIVGFIAGALYLCGATLG